MSLQEFLTNLSQLSMKNGRKLKSLEILKNLIDLFAKVAKIEAVKDSLAANFIPALIKILKDNIDNRPLVKNALVS